jgi:hypothetical protein
MIYRMGLLFWQLWCMINRKANIKPPSWMVSGLSGPETRSLVIRSLVDDPSDLINTRRLSPGRKPLDLWSRGFLCLGAFWPGDNLLVWSGHSWMTQVTWSTLVDCLRAESPPRPGVSGLSDPETMWYMINRKPLDDPSDLSRRLSRARRQSTRVISSLGSSTRAVFLL